MAPTPSFSPIQWDTYDILAKIEPIYMESPTSDYEKIILKRTGMLLVKQGVDHNNPSLLAKVTSTTVKSLLTVPNLSFVKRYN